MQTFLPYASFEDSAAVLDNRRLGKQRVEGTQILTILLTPNYRGAWRNHPAVRMWRGYEEALRLYINAVVTEWIGRGYRNSLATYDLTGRPIVFPFWLGDPRLHDSHKSNLLRKDFSYYSQFGWDVPPDLPYYWPV
ncbi:hypothetical protein EI42_03207 [Thermosporothrix hazakensis]|uniref:Uncharacterized protein n=2 Tax=Thermosporothrix TaxID=768650 RepID=A0A326U5A5_THEHA|nr:MSMEG_6728 family protein [Thermosporothrix hazakensis]PZW28453.1 hypothetical protein EI42_03207 [Thermosporothrix hazakensis]BBH86354.1 hypothetical protein KTC_11050 [Thermosporothrix sp. COM3]GCE45231.1 hypothetical protein KTH_01000 [Thermosporothrix hazakensis]